MEKQPPMPDLGASVDWETFQRVWKRVMPDESKSPIEIILPTKSTQTKPDRMSITPHLSQDTVQASMQSLESMFQHLCRGIGSVAAAAGQQGQASFFAVLLRQRQQALRQLQTLYFLNTGRNYTCQPTRSTQRIPQMKLLREQYQWEREWSRMCRAYAAQTEETDIAQLCGQLERQAMERQQKIRNILEHGV